MNNHTTRERQLTREERIYRRSRIVYLLCIVLWAVVLIAALLIGRKTDDEQPAKAADTPATQTEKAVVVQVIPQPIATNVDAEAVPMERDPVREDIPLNAETQMLLWQACEEFGLDCHIMVALIERETNFRNVVGDGGASVGYCQIQKKWWSGLMEEIGAKDLTDPLDNFRTGCAILIHLLERYDGDIAKALVAYNQGHYKGVVTEYAVSILARTEAWRGDENG